MPRAIVEELVRARRFGPVLRMRVDLHGVSTFGPGEEHTLIRWERIEEITCGHGVVVRSARHEIMFPSGVFGIGRAALAERLEQARSIEHRADVIEELGRSASRADAHEEQDG